MNYVLPIFINMQATAINIKTIIQEELKYILEQKPDSQMFGQSDYGLSGDYTAAELVRNAEKQSQAKLQKYFGCL